MSNIEKIRQEIERLKKICKDNITISKSGSFPYVMEMTGYDKIRAFIDALPDNDFLDESIIASKDLEEAALNYIAPIENDEGLDYINFNGRDIKDAFIAGAEWQYKNTITFLSEVMFQDMKKGICGWGEIPEKK